MSSDLNGIRVANALRGVKYRLTIHEGYKGAWVKARYEYFNCREDAHEYAARINSRPAAPGLAIRCNNIIEEVSITTNDEL
jgi:hypothetical protein